MNKPILPTIRGVCDNFQAPQERMDDMQLIIKEAKLHSDIAVEEKKTMQGTLLLGFYTEHGVFRLVVQPGLPIKGRLYMNGLTEDEMLTNPLIRLFYSSIHFMGATGMIRLYEEGTSKDIHFREGKIFEMDYNGNEKELYNIIVEEYIDQVLVQSRMNYLLEKLGELLKEKNVKRKINEVKQELVSLHSKHILIK